MIYHLYKTMSGVDNLWYEQNNIRTSFSIDSSNRHTQNFKKQINADEAQLADADGNLMTAEQAKAYVKELP